MIFSRRKRAQNCRIHSFHVKWRRFRKDVQGPLVDFHACIRSQCSRNFFAYCCDNQVKS